VIPGNGAGLGPGGDAVKVHAGAHDIRVLSGFIACGLKRPKKHQDAIQAMGGSNVVFQQIVSRDCANSFMFINTGRGHRGTPKGIQCVDCNARTNNYSVYVGHSVDSGALHSVFNSRVRPKISAGAVSPVLVSNRWTRNGAEHRRKRRE
jgi:hypothetical protein